MLAAQLALLALLAVGVWQTPRIVGPTSITYTQPACRGGAAGWDTDQPATCQPEPPAWSQDNYR